MTVVIDGISASHTINLTVDPAAIIAADSTVTVSAPLAVNSSSTTTVTAKDAYGNLISGYTFKMVVTVTNATTSGALGYDESYTVDSSTYTSTGTAVSLTNPTNSSGVVTFDISIPANGDSGDGVSVQLYLNDGTTPVGSAISYIAP